MVPGHPPFGHTLAYIQSGVLVELPINININNYCHHLLSTFMRGPIEQNDSPSIRLIFLANCIHTYVHVCC